MGYKSLGVQRIKPPSPGRVLSAKDKNMRQLDSGVRINGAAGAGRPEGRGYSPGAPKWKY